MRERSTQLSFHRIYRLNGRLKLDFSAFEGKNNHVRWPRTKEQKGLSADMGIAAS